MTNLSGFLQLKMPLRLNYHGSFRGNLQMLHVPVAQPIKTTRHKGLGGSGCHNTSHVIFCPRLISLTASQTWLGHNKCISLMKYHYSRLLWGTNCQSCLHLCIIYSLLCPGKPPSLSLVCWFHLSPTFRVLNLPIWKGKKSYLLKFLLVNSERLKCFHIGEKKKLLSLLIKEQYDKYSNM